MCADAAVDLEMFSDKFDNHTIINAIKCSVCIKESVENVLFMRVQLRSE